MINIKSKYGGVESHIEGSKPVITAEAIAANVALTKAIAEIKGVSFENASLFIMQESIKIHSKMRVVEENE